MNSQAMTIDRERLLKEHTGSSNDIDARTKAHRSRAEVWYFALIPS